MGLKDDDSLKCETCFKDSEYFNALSKDELTELCHHKSCRDYKKGELVYQEGNRPRGIYYLKKGVVKHYKVGIDGKEQILRFSKAGDIFGFTSVLNNEPACTTTKAIEDISLCFIPQKKFIEMVHKNSDFSMNILQLSCKELGEANQYIIDIAQKNVRERLAEILLLLHKDFGTDKEGTLQILLTREELAGFVGTATESVIRLLSEFKKDKLIELNKRKIKIINFDKLERLSNVI